MEWVELVRLRAVRERLPAGERLMDAPAGHDAALRAAGPLTLFLTVESVGEFLQFVRIGRLLEKNDVRLPRLHIFEYAGIPSADAAVDRRDAHRLRTIHEGGDPGLRLFRS